MKGNKTFAVLGLGRFGTAIAAELSEYGYEVIAIDSDLNSVEQISEVVTQAVRADFTEIDQLRQIGVQECDAAVVATGSHLEESVLAVMNLKELGVPTVLAKAKNKKFADILQKIGADRVVIPEKESGERVARQLVSSNIVDLIDLDDEYSIVEMRCPLKWTKKTLRELNLRSQYGINVLGIRKRPNERLSISPSADYVLETSDQLMVIADNKLIDKIEALNKE
ncbi:MAG: TrkA family potassium uptake protein [Erysipelotrichaceae bacterium]|nr:TrkA family potassium uptake protein [Erysipelotrichaceae bacterium]